jgi:lipoprotein-releasing system permease protein
MSTPLFIAKRIYFSKDVEKQVSPPAIHIAIISMALGLTVMILSIAIVIGFKKEVRNKVVGFGSHIQITNFDSNSSYETHPIAISDSLLNQLQAIPNIRHVQAFASKPAILKTENDFFGVILKGIDENFDWDFFGKNLKDGSVLTFQADSTNNNILISSIIADKLKLKTGDAVNCFFIQEPPRARRFTIAGIYQTNFSDYDKLFIIGDIRQIRRLSDWEDDMVGGLEILVENYSRLDTTYDTVFYDLSVRTDRLGNHYYPRSIRQLNPQIFAWLDVLNTNVVVILVLMALVAGFSMISGLLIIILERTNMIGILKAMGENNTGIRQVFLYVSVFLIGRGLFWGNLIALSIYFVQKYTGLLKLNPEIYYVAEVPVELKVWSWILINAGSLIITFLMLIGPSYLVAKISPAKTIRFE